ncbi:DUF4097 family beta strand repeat-containing protein [Hymenobacter latericus]|uniref:hypothetical protein n=1 Tax=Hymenobacter sp. YIM 151858-1 TaxID=2987688 RepID=UPI002227D637|nr:hypothetical protein [Hymenobacter sp. YIM 151858-1]UYZ58957.1 hypothetical protein OIS50_18090 [Hymenobacter sp. YIM 151858-1]
MRFLLRPSSRLMLPLLAALATVAAPAAAQVRAALVGGFVQPCPEVRYWDQPTPEAPFQQVQQNGAQPDPAAAPLPAFEKSRKISRTFKAVPGRQFTLDTRYGRVQVNTWSRNEIKTEVDITARADEEAKAQQLLDMIQVLMQEQPGPEGGLVVQTRLGEMPRECYSRQRLYEINYTVWMPKNTPLKVRNSFGDVSLTGDLTGPADLSVCYGSLRTARLDGPRNSVRINNGAAAVQYARQATLEANHSRLRLEEGQQVDLRNNGSDIDIGTVENLAVHSKYGDVNLGTVRSLQGTTGYSRFSVYKVSEQLDMKVQYCPAFEVRTTGPNFRRINVDGGYSTILLNFPDNAGFVFDVNSENGKVQMDKRFVKVRTEENSSSLTEVQGQYGVVQARPTRPASSVNIRTRYSNVSFNR